MWSIGTRLPSNSLSPLLEAVVESMVAMVVARQLKWLYNQLKVPTVSRIPYIQINLFSDRPWREASSNDSSWWLFIFISFFSPLGFMSLHEFEAAVQDKKTLHPFWMWYLSFPIL